MLTRQASGSSSLVAGLYFTTQIKPVPQNRKLSRGRGSRLFLNKDYVICWTAIESEWRRQYTGEPLRDKVSVEIGFGWTRMDLDSCIKSILDTLQAAEIYLNDRQVDRLLIYRIPTPEIIIKIN